MRFCGMRLTRHAHICSNFDIMTGILDNRKCKMLLGRERYVKATYA
jgi:hypothetical protein